MLHLQTVVLVELALVLVFLLKPSKIFTALLKLTLPELVLEYYLQSSLMYESCFLLFFKTFKI